MARDRATDLVIETLAQSEAELHSQVVSLEAEVAIYRELAVAGFEALCRLTVRCEALRHTYARREDQQRQSREERLMATGAIT